MSLSIENKDHLISLGQRAWTDLKKLLIQERWSTVFVLTDEASKKHCFPLFKKNFSEKEIVLLTIPQGEASKSIEWAQKLWEELANKGADRRSLIINLGGGVVTDLGGFVASTYRRGIDYVNLPTTLLSMVDAAIGGKTGIDLGVLKNQIGVVAQPKGIFIIPEFLETLPQRELTSGWMEMVKHGFISDKKYLESCLNTPSKDNPDLSRLIWGSVQIKNTIVTEDPYEYGKRKTLNFGHTLGHAIESYCLDHHSVEYIKHGEAIGIGMALALYLSFVTQRFPEKALDKYIGKLKLITPDFKFDRQQQKQIIDYLKHDKKNSHGRINFVLLKEVGHYVLDCQITNNQIFDAFEFWQSNKG